MFFKENLCAILNKYVCLMLFYGIGFFERMLNFIQIKKLFTDLTALLFTREKDSKLYRKDYKALFKCLIFFFILFIVSNAINFFSLDLQMLNVPNCQ